MSPEPALFIATEKFDPSDGKKWEDYCQWAQIPGLVELVSLDGMMCPHLIKDFVGEDWDHNVNADFMLDFFYHLDYLVQRVRHVNRKNVLGLYRNPDGHIATPPGPGEFSFMGYDLIGFHGHISALSNCGGFPEAFANDELNRYGLVETFDRASAIKRSLVERYPEEVHAHCDLYAIWRLSESADDL